MPGQKFDNFYKRTLYCAARAACLALRLKVARDTARDQVDVSRGGPPRKLRSTAIDTEEPLRLEMATTIGEKLRLAREERGISLRDISEQTRISMRFLEAIETNDYKRLPGGIFNKSFIRSYAKYIGYDEREAMEGYANTLREKGESPDDIQITPAKSLVYTDAGSNRSPLVTLLLALFILAVLSLGAIAALHWYQRRTAPRAGTPPAPGAQLMTGINRRTPLRHQVGQRLMSPGEGRPSC